MKAVRWARSTSTSRCPRARRGLLSVSAVWFGFPMNLGNAVFGGVIVYNLGLAQGAAAILLGNLVLFAYVGALSWLAGRTGENFSHQAARTFGTLGSRIPAAFLSTVVIGWYSFQIGLSGTTLQEALGWAPLLGALAGESSTPCSPSSASAPCR